MCAPLACAVLGKRAHIRRPGIWLYNLGRFISYVLAGGILGALTGAAGALYSPLGQGISFILGMALILVGLWRLAPNWSPGRFSIPIRFGQNLVQSISRLPSGLRDFTLGLATVVLPCMTLTPALTMAAASQSALYGALFMAAFALGTIPIMLAATNVPLVIYRRIPAFMTRWVVGLFLLGAGIITFIRGLA